MSQLQLLIVGGGYVAQEKLHFLLKSSPDAQVTVMAPDIAPEILELFTSTDKKINLIKSRFSPEILDQFDVVIAATNIKELNHEVYKAAKERRVLINVADTPDLCDFYMGSIVTKGDLKIGISTNGKSPTFAKRFRQWLEQNLPDEIEDLLPNLRSLRDQLHMNFSEKVEYLNKVTKSLLEKDQSN